jgi:phage head maturation protease
MEEKRVFGFNVETKDLSAIEPRTLMITGSTENVDRDGDILTASGWKLDNYRKNPVVLWAHDYNRPPVGMAKAVFVDPRTKTLQFKVYFPTVEELTTPGQPPSDHALLVDTLYNMYKSGLLNASSVGFTSAKGTQRTDQEDTPIWMRGTLFTEQELVELSCVPVPANAEALVSARSMKSFNQKGLDLVEKMIHDAEGKGAIPYHKYPLAPADATWDAGAEVKDATVEDLKKMCAWYDAENPDIKGSYKLPHHTREGYKTVKAAVDNAMARLGQTNLPAADKAAVEAHLKKHQAELEEEGKAAHVEAKGEDMADKLTEEEVVKLKAFIAGLAPQTKAGRKLSAETMKSLKEVHDHAENCLKCVKALISSGVEENENNSTGTEEGEGDNNPGNPKNAQAVVTKSALDLSTITVEQANEILRQAETAKGA